MTDILQGKELFRNAIKMQIAEQIANVILPEFPNAHHVWFNPNVEYYDEDFEYYNSTIKVYDANESGILDLNETSWDDEETVDKAENLASKLFQIVNTRDFAFAYGLEGAQIDISFFKNE